MVTAFDKVHCIDEFYVHNVKLAQPVVFMFKLLVVQMLKKFKELLITFYENDPAIHKVI